MASRILGMGDVLTLIEKASRHGMDEQKAMKMVDKMRRSENLDFNDLLDQMDAAEKDGPALLGDRA